MSKYRVRDLLITLPGRLPPAREWVMGPDTDLAPEVGGGPLAGWDPGVDPQMPQAAGGAPADPPACDDAPACEDTNPPASWVTGEECGSTPCGDCVTNGEKDEMQDGVSGRDCWAFAGPDSCLGPSSGPHPPCPEHSCAIRTCPPQSGPDEPVDCENNDVNNTGIPPECHQHINPGTRPACADGDADSDTVPDCCDYDANSDSVCDDQNTCFCQNDATLVAGDSGVDPGGGSGDPDCAMRTDVNLKLLRSRLRARLGQA